jgi:hypothetical protein
MAEPINQYTWRAEVVDALDGEKAAKVLVRVIACAACGEDMAKAAGHFATQCKRAGLCIISGVHTPNGEICTECDEAGAAAFRCALCGQKRPSNEIKELFGAPPPDALCQHCFETVTASAWNDAVVDLQEKHRFDYE